MNLLEKKEALDNEFAGCISSKPQLEISSLNNISCQDKKSTCHGLGCFNYATHSIQEDGYDGTLNLCDNCIKKFPREVTDEPQTFNNSFPERYTNFSSQNRLISQR